ncbi:MAG: hypothetical protein GX564_13665 [Oligosphaeraceae bacterium]|jgi:hypothetical protein|nr:hypothetical protein [Oligosphaeraceae bacterium]
MSKYYYVCLLKDIATEPRHYTGFMGSLADRLARHNRRFAAALQTTPKFWTICKPIIAYGQQPKVPAFIAGAARLPPSAKRRVSEA